MHGDPILHAPSSSCVQVSGSLTEDILQDTVAKYLRHVGTIDHTLQGRLVDSALTNVSDWRQRQSMCTADTVWEEGTASCVPCPAGLVQPLGGQTECVPPSSDLGLKVGVPVAAAVVLLIVLAIVRNEYIKSKNVRNVKNAPKKSPVTLMFTGAWPS